MPCTSSLSSSMLLFAFSLFLSLFMKWLLQLADLSSQFSARHFSSDSLHALPFSLHPLIFFPLSLLPSSSLNFSNTLFLSVFHSLLLSFIALAVLRPFRSVCAVSNGSPQTSWLEKRKKSAKLLQGFEQGRRNSSSHTQERKKTSQQKSKYF